jgi:hypothetical protein
MYGIYIMMPLLQICLFFMVSHIVALTADVDRTMAQAVSRRPLTAAAWVRARVNTVGFVVGKVALGQVFLRVLRFSPVNIIPP